jgi:hypothetical protein
VSSRRNPLAAALAGDLQDFVCDSEDWFVHYGHGTCLPVTEVVRSDMYHECPLCDMSAISRGAVHSVLICPTCGLEMMISMRKESE